MINLHIYNPWLLEASLDLIEEETSEVEERLRSKLGKSGHEDFRAVATEMLSGDSGRRVEQVSKYNMLNILERHKG